MVAPDYIEKIPNAQTEEKMGCLRFLFQEGAMGVGMQVGSLTGKRQVVLLGGQALYS